MRYAEIVVGLSDARAAVAEFFADELRQRAVSVTPRPS